MPINPKAGEEKNDFISRCMSTEKDSFPDQKQRLAVCHTAWRGEKAMKSQVNNYNKIVKSATAVMESVGKVIKAEEGDKRMIFGRPSTYTSGKWVADEGRAGDREPEEEFDEDPSEQLNQEMLEDTNLGLIDGEPEGERSEADTGAQMMTKLDEMGITPDQYLKDTNNPTDQEIKDAYEYFVEAEEMDEDIPEGGEQMVDTLEFNKIDTDAMSWDEIKAKFDEMGFELDPDEPWIDDEGGEAEEISAESEYENEIDKLERQIDSAGVEPWKRDRLIQERDELQQEYDELTKACDKEPVMKSQNENFNRVQKALAGVQDALVKTGATTTDEEHSHSYQVDVDGNGSTTGMIGSHGIPHTHSIKEFITSTVNGHFHTVI